MTLVPPPLRFGGYASNVCVAGIGEDETLGSRSRCIGYRSGYPLGSARRACHWVRAGRPS